MRGHTTVAIGDQQAFSGAAGQSIVFNTDNLRNIYHSSLLIDEIRFYVLTNGVLGSNNILLQKKPLDLFDALQVQFDVHGYKMSAAPVAIDLLCTDFQTALEQEVAPNTQCVYQESFRRWIPPNPILLPPGDSLLTRIVNNGLPGLVGSFVVWVVAVGRISDEPVPETCEVPYVLPYDTSKNVAPDVTGLVAAGLTQFTAPVFALQNPLDRDLMIQRIIMRLTASGGFLTPLAGRDIIREIPDLVAVEITDSQGYSVAKSMDMGAFVDAQRHAWTFKRALESHGYLKAQFTLNTANAAYAPFTAFPQICLVGSREEVIR